MLSEIHHVKHNPGYYNNLQHRANTRILQSEQYDAAAETVVTDRALQVLLTP